MAVIEQKSGSTRPGDERRGTTPSHGEDASVGAAPSAAPSAMAALRAATWPAHRQLERQLDLDARFGSRMAYRRHLGQLWGFSAALEAAVDGAAVQSVLPDYARRHKRPLIERDLCALGLDFASIERLPRCAAFVPSADVSVALGRLYVLEGATLGGRSLLPLVERRLGLTAIHGAGFLASYCAEVAEMWRVFGAVVDAWCATPDRRARATTAATATFTALATWLCGADS